MTHYRLYSMNPASGHIERATDIDASNDEEAIEISMSLLEDQAVELWCGARKVHRIDAPSAAVPGHYPAQKFANEHESAS